MASTISEDLSIFEKGANLISVKSKAKFRIGFAQVDHRLNDLVFDFDLTKKNIFVLEMKKYLKSMFKIAS